MPLKSKSRQKIKDARTTYVREPPEIIYDEDRIRDTFYRDHPFELDRSIVNEEYGKNIVWNDIFGGSPENRLRGEK